MDEANLSHSTSAALKCLSANFWEKLVYEISTNLSNPNLPYCPVLLCISVTILDPPPQSPHAQQKYVFDMVDGQYRYKGHVVMAPIQSKITPSIENVRLIRGKVVKLINYKILSSRQKHIVVCYHMEILEGDFLHILDKIIPGISHHPGLSVTKVDTSGSSGMLTNENTNQNNSYRNNNNANQINMYGNANISIAKPNSNQDGQNQFNNNFNENSKMSSNINNSLNSVCENNESVRGGRVESSNMLINVKSNSNFNNTYNHNFDLQAGNPYATYSNKNNCISNKQNVLNSNNNIKMNNNNIVFPSSLPASSASSASSVSSYGPLRNTHNKITQQVTVSSAPYSTTGPVARRTDGMLLSINDLSQYTSKWIIKARVVSKSEIKKFTNARGEGQLFNIDLCDKNGEIRAAFFGRAVDRWYSEINENCVYTFSKGVLKAANKRFNSLKHSCEITFDENAQINIVEEDYAIPKVNYDFIPINKLNEKDVGNSVDVIAIVSSFREVQPITLKSTGQQKDKRELFLIDDSGMSISLSLWGEKASILDESTLTQHPVVAFKGLKVGEWQGRKLDSTGSTKIETFPDNDRAVTLQMWWEKEGKSVPQASMSMNLSLRDVSYKTIEQIIEEASAASPDILAEKGIYFTCQCTIEKINEEKFSWPACPDCKKKMQENSDPMTGVSNSWTCNHCNLTLEKPNHTYLLNITILDHTGFLKCTAMGERAEEIMGDIKADDLYTLQEHQGLDSLARNIGDIFSNLAFTEWTFRLKAQSETYMDEIRTKYRIYSAIPTKTRINEEIMMRLNYIKSKIS